MSEAVCAFMDGALVAGTICLFVGSYWEWKQHKAHCLCKGCKGYRAQLRAEGEKKLKDGTEPDEA